MTTFISPSSRRKRSIQLPFVSPSSLPSTPVHLPTGIFPHTPYAPARPSSGAAQRILTSDVSGSVTTNPEMGSSEDVP